MVSRWLGIIVAAFPAVVGAQTGHGPYARIAILRPHAGQPTDFEYVRLT